MKQLIIDLSEEQYNAMTNHLQNGATLNIENETFSGFEIRLKCIEGNLSSWVEVEMNGSVDLEEVNWEIK